MVFTMEERIAQENGSRLLRYDNLLEAFLERTYGLHVTTVLPLEATNIGTSAVQVLKQDSNRLMYLITNISSNIVYALFDGSVAPGNGMILDAGGGKITSWLNEDAIVTGTELWLAADTIDSSVYGFQILGVA